MCAAAVAGVQMGPDPVPQEIWGAGCGMAGSVMSHRGRQNGLSPSVPGGPWEGTAWLFPTPYPQGGLMWARQVLE